MRHLNVLVAAVAHLQLTHASVDSTQIHGLSPEFAKYYTNQETFTCISYPSITLKSSQINDNYCDCPDGSDEPGTSACTHLSSLSPAHPLPESSTGTTNTTNSLPGFYCQNVGHEPGYIPFTYVNDGVCDYEGCCDGSDEWAQVGGVKCENRCDKMGKEYRKKAEIREKAMTSARRRREEMVREAGKARQVVVDKVKKLEAEVTVLGKREADAKARLEEMEKKDKMRVVAGGNVKATKVSLLAGLAKARIDELRGGIMTIMQKKSAAKARIEELENILAAFKEDYNPNFNDEGVKRAVKAWEDYAATHLSTENTDAADDADLLSIAEEDSESQGINWAEWKEEDVSDVDALYKFEEYLPTSARNWLREKVLSLRLLLIENGILADNSTPGTESSLVSSARDAYQAITDEKSTKEAQIGEENHDLTKDYGAEDIFRALKGKCINQDSGEYNYELCWMDRTTQKSKKGGGNTGLGNFARFDSIEVDEDVNAEGKGLGVGKRMTLVYENGQHCWNGPNRMTTVVLACAEKDEIWKVVELEKCVYRMDVGTPVACESETLKETATAGPKDEL